MNVLPGRLLFASSDASLGCATLLLTRDCWVKVDPCEGRLVGDVLRWFSRDSRTESPRKNQVQEDFAKAASSSRWRDQRNWRRRGWLSQGAEVGRGLTGQLRDFTSLGRRLHHTKTLIANAGHVMHQKLQLNNRPPAPSYVA
jgi:hypothetical protein